MEPTLPSGRRTEAMAGAHRATASPSAGLRDIQMLVAALVIVLMPFPSVLATLMQRRGGYDFQALIFPSDVAVFALAVLCLSELLRSGRRLGAVLTTLAILLAVLVVAFVVHPADRGFLNLVRYAGTLSLAWVLATTRDRTHRQFLFGAVVLAAGLQAVLAFAQLVNGSGIGLGGLGEFPEPFHVFGGDVLAPQGTMVHIYLLAGLSLLAATTATTMWVRGRWPWLAAAAICIAPVGVTYSRTAAIGLGCAVAALVLGGVLRRRQALSVAALVLVAAAGVAAAIWPDGWSERVTSVSSGRRSVDTVSTGRGHLMDQAFDLIGDEPVVGVGTGRYVLALRDRDVDPTPSGVLKPVHNVPLLAGAEGGIAALVAATLLVVLLGIRAWTGGPAALAVYLAFLPYVLLDHFPYSFPQGIVMTGIWIGVIELLARERAAADHGRSDELP